MPDVSVVMSTYKENPNYVEEAINSILSQTYRNLELIIIVDWPENEPVKRLLYRRQAKDRRIVIVENEHNLGLANSLNKALKIAKGDYICRMVKPNKQPIRQNATTQYERRHATYGERRTYRALSSQNATALAAATLRESTPCAIGIFTV